MSDLNINILGELAKDPFVFTQQPDVFRVSFTTSDSPFRLRQVHKVAQMVAKIFLTTRGSDSLSPNTGTGIRSLIGRLVSRSNLPDIQHDIALWVSDTEDQMRVEQENYALPLDERLARLDLVTAAFDFTKLTWTIRVNITTEAGEQTTINVGPQLGPAAPDVTDIGIRDVLSIDSTDLL